MGKILVIGAGGVSSVAVHKMAQLIAAGDGPFSEIVLASRTFAKCEAIAESVKERTGVAISTSQIDADDVPALTALIEQEKPDLVVNLALPYQDLPIMDACLATRTDYLDTANYEPRDEAKFEIDLAAGFCFQLFQKADQRVTVIIVTRDMMSAAKIDPFQAAEMRRDNRLDFLPGPLQSIEALFAEIVEVDAREMLKMVRPQLADREAQPAMGLARIIFLRLAQRDLRVNS